MYCNDATMLDVHQGYIWHDLARHVAENLTGEDPQVHVDQARLVDVHTSMRSVEFCFCFFVCAPKGTTLLADIMSCACFWRPRRLRRKLDRRHPVELLQKID